MPRDRNIRKFLQRENKSFKRAIIISTFGLIIFLIVAFTFPLGNSLFSNLFVKPTSNAATAPTYDVGFQIRTINYTPPNASPKPLTYGIWYPTQDATQSYNYNRRIAPPGQAAINASVFSATPSAYPLIVLSHGAGGCGTIYVYLESYLAAHGYIVAAPDHEDAGIFCTINNEVGLGLSNCPKRNLTNFLCYRPEDISAVIMIPTYFPGR